MRPNPTSHAEHSCQIHRGLTRNRCIATKLEIPVQHYAQRFKLSCETGMTRKLKGLVRHANEISDAEPIS